MNWKILKHRYSDVWDEMYEQTKNDLLLCMPTADILEFKEGWEDSRIERIAHNAAFNACSIVHKRI